jgi:hypothetical protein
MARMQMRFVFDAQAFRRESFRQFLCDDIFGLHIRCLSHVAAASERFEAEDRCDLANVKT